MPMSISFDITQNRLMRWLVLVGVVLVGLGVLIGGFAVFASHWGIIYIVMSVGTHADSSYSLIEAFRDTYQQGRPGVSYSDGQLYAVFAYKLFVGLFCFTSALLFLIRKKIGYFLIILSVIILLVDMLVYWVPSYEWSDLVQLIFETALIFAFILSPWVRKLYFSFEKPM